MVVWLIGLSGSGKTTLGTEVARQWQTIAPNTVFLDGDLMREIFQHDQGDAPFTVEGRRIAAKRMVALCEFLDRQGINVVCAILSIFQDMRTENRKRFTRYFEIFMDAPLEVLKRRDMKGLYSAAERGEMGNVVGIDIPFERPVGPDMIIDSSTDCPDIERLAAEVLKQVIAQ